MTLSEKHVVSAFFNGKWFNPVSLRIIEDFEIEHVAETLCSQVGLSRSRSDYSTIIASYGLVNSLDNGLITLHEYMFRKCNDGLRDFDVIEFEVDKVSMLNLETKTKITREKIKGKWVEVRE